MRNVLYRIYQLFIGVPLFGISTVLTSLQMVVGCRFGNPDFWAYWPTKWWGKVAVRGMLLPIKVEGSENIKDDESYVFVANHQGFYDILIIYGYLKHNIKWMMKWQISKWPVIGIATVKSRQIMVDKRSRAAIKRTYDDARKTLQGGASVVLFPEGARTYTGHMGFFRRGAFALADELQLPVVPLTINGSFDVFPRTKKNCFPNWHPLKLTIHKPIYPQSKGEDNQHRLMQESYDAIMSALVPEYQGYVENPDQ